MLSQLPLRVGVDKRAVIGVDWGDNLLSFFSSLLSFSFSRWPSITPIGITFILLPRVKSNVGSGWNKNHHCQSHQHNFQHRHHHHCYYHRHHYHHLHFLDLNPLHQGLGWSTHELRRHRLQPDGLQRHREASNQGWNFWTKTPLQEQFVIQLGQRKMLQ